MAVQKSQKIIDFGKNRKAICDFLLVINSNCGRISYCFAIFPTPFCFDALA